MIVMMICLMIKHQRKLQQTKKSGGFEFGDSDEDDTLFASMKPKSTPGQNRKKSSPKHKPHKPKKPSSTSMFGDSSSDDDDPLSNLIDSQKETPQQPQEPKGEISKKAGIKIDVIKLLMGMGG
eukprot:439278_1